MKTIQPISFANGILSRAFGLKVIRAKDPRYVKFDYAPNVHSRRKQGSSARRLQSIIGEGAPHYAEVLRGFSTYIEHLTRIPSTPSDGRTPGWINGYIPALDGVSIYCFLASRNPSVYFEVGSGNSTKFARRAIDDHGLRTRIVSVDPYPRAEIDALCDEVIRKPCEDVSPQVFEDLPADSVVFVDNSHRGFQNSDVTVCFTEIIPCLKPGTLYGIHDIFLPEDYPASWEAKYYNEQYYLETYLHGGAGGDRIELPAKYVSGLADLHGLLETLWTHPNLREAEHHGGAFWLTRSPDKVGSPAA